MAVTVAQTTYNQLVGNRDNTVLQLANLRQQNDAMQQQIEFYEAMVADYELIIAELEVGDSNG